MVRGGGAPTLEARTVTPSTSQQIIKPSRDEYDGLSQVTVEATPLETRTVNPSTSSQTITPSGSNIGFSTVTVNPYRLQSKNVTPSTNAQTVSPDSGYNGLSSVYVYKNTLQDISVSPSWKTQRIYYDGNYQGINECTINPIEDAYWYFNTVFVGNGTQTVGIPITLPFEYVGEKIPFVKMCTCGSLSNTVTNQGLNMSSSWDESVGFGGVTSITSGWNKDGYFSQINIGIAASISGTSSTDWPHYTLNLSTPSEFPFVNGWQYAVGIMVIYKNLN